MAEQNSVAKKQQAPAPDDSRKPDAPTEVHKPAWGYVFKRALAEFSQDKCTTLAAALTYYAVLAIFPALLALVSLVGLFGQAKQTTDLLLQIIGNFADASVVETLRGPIEALATSNSAGWALAIGIIAAIWSASGYVSAFSQAMNQVYEVDEGRPFWKLRPTVLIITVILLILAVIVVLLLLISGPVAQGIGNALGLGQTVVTVWNIAKWPVLVFIAVLMIAIIYYGSPNVKQPRFKWISVGAIIALVVMAIASLLFFFYVSNFGNYQKTYGSIAGVIVLLLWIWIANLSLLFGAEFDAELERGRELQGGIEAAETIQLPPRDDRQTKKRHAKEEKLVDAGRDLREESSDDGNTGNNDRS